MGDIPYIAGMVINELGKPTKLVPILVSRNDNNTLVRAYLTSDLAILHNDDTKVSGYTESFDIGSNFASDKYTAPVTGYYQVNFNIYFSDAEAKLTICQSRVYKGGVNILTGTTWMGTDKSAISCPGNDAIYLVAGEYIELWGYCQTSDSSAAVMSGGSALTYLSVHLIST